MPKWVYIVFYLAVLILSNIAQRAEDEDKSKLFYTISINLLAAEVWIMGKPRTLMPFPPSSRQVRKDE